MLSKSFLKYFLLISLFVLPTQNLLANWVNDQLNTLSIEERESLRHFFSTFIKEEHLGHVLFFSNKPACLGGGFIGGPKSIDKKIFMKGWNVWRAKEHLFPHPNFIIYDEIVDFNGEKALHIYFINKKTLLKAFSNQEIALPISDFSLELFIESLEKKTISSLLDEDQTVRGILLGFGKESALAYRLYKKEERPQEMKVVFCSHHKKLRVHPVTFIGNCQSDEVRQLQEQYAVELEKIERLYQKRDLLKASLQALCSTFE